jgi:transcription antitermination factor NusG
MYQDDHAWFAVQVRPRHELTTATILRNKGLEEFVPIYISRRQWSDRKKDLVLPLFTGYVFCNFSIEDKLTVVTTPGVIRIVGSSRGPSPIADHEIASIKTAAQLPAKVHPYPYLAIGTRVKVREGPFAGLEGILANYKNRSQLVLSLDLVQRSMAIEVDSHITSIVDDRGDAHMSRRPQLKTRHVARIAFTV